MMTEYVVWGTPTDSPDWDERVLKETMNKETALDTVYEAKRLGYRNVRIMEFGSKKTNFFDEFRKAVNV